MRIVTSNDDQIMMVRIFVLGTSTLSISLVVLAR